MLVKYSLSVIPTKPKQKQVNRNRNTKRLSNSAQYPTRRKHPYHLVPDQIWPPKCVRSLNTSLLLENQSFQTRLLKTRITICDMWRVLVDKIIGQWSAPFQLSHVPFVDCLIFIFFFFFCSWSWTWHERIPENVGPNVWGLIPRPNFILGIFSMEVICKNDNVNNNKCWCLLVRNIKFAIAN